MGVADAWLVAAVAAEISDGWTGARVERAVQSGPRELCLQLRRPGASGHLLLAASPPLARVHLIPARLPAIAPMPTFGQFARRHLEGSRLLAVTQPGLERIIEFACEGRDELGNPRRLILVAELTGQLANLLLLGPDRHILDALRRVPGEEDGARTLLPGAPYVPPPRPAAKVDPVEAAAAEGWPRLGALLADAWAQRPPEPAATRLQQTVFGLTPSLAAALAAWAAGAPGAPPPPQGPGDPLALAVGGLARSVVERRFEPAIGTDRHGRPVPLAWGLPGTAARPAASANAACLEAYGQRAAAERRDQRRATIDAALRIALERVERRLAKQESEMAAAADAERLRREGELLLCSLHRIPRGATTVTLPALEDPATVLTLALDPRLSAVQNAEARMRRYRKAKRAQAAVAARLAEGRAEREYLLDARWAATQAGGDAEVDALADELTREGVLRPRRGRGAPAPGRGTTAPTPPLAFDGGSGWRILVGRNASGNDRLTMRSAHPQDIWLHARQIPGSHVLLQPPPGAEGDEPPERALLAAARCAAYYSAGREGRHIAVDWTRRRHVRKPPGARPGFVLYDGERTVLVDPVDLPPPLPNA